METMFYVTEDTFAPWVAPLQKGKGRREALKAMVEKRAPVTLSPVVKALATDVVPARGEARRLDPQYNADYAIRGKIVAASKSPRREKSPSTTIWPFVLDCGFHTRLDVRDVTIEDPFDPSTHYTSKLRFDEGDYVELEGTLEAQEPGDHGPFTSTLHGTTVGIVPIARGLGVFLTLAITKAEPYRASGGGRR